MTNKAGTRERSAVGGTQVSPLNFGIEFLLEDPQDIRSMKSRIVFPESSGQKPTKESVDEDGEENGEVEESFDVRVLKFRKKELEDEIREIEKLEKARKVQNGDGNDEKRPLKRSPPKRKPRPDDDDEDSDS